MQALGRGQKLRFFRGEVTRECDSKMALGRLHHPGVVELLSESAPRT